MPFVQPSRTDVHVDAIMTNISIAEHQDTNDFVADRAFQTIPVNKASDKYYRYDRGDFARNMMERRAPMTPAASADYKISTDSYSTDQWGLKRGIAMQVRNNADAPLDMDRDATLFLTQQGLLNREVNWKNEYFKTGVWTTTGTLGAGKWDVGTSEPIQDIRNAKRATHLAGGRRPNIAVCTRQVYDALVDHPDIVGRIDRGQTTGTALVLRQTIASILELDELLVMDGIENTENEGGTDTFAFISGADGFLLLYRPPNPGILTPAAGYTFAWNGFGDFPSATGMTIRRFFSDELMGDFLEINSFYDQKVVSAGMGAFWDDVIG